MLDACADLECRADLVAAARHFVRTSLREWELEALADNAVLVTSELVANAVLHARTNIRVRLESDGLSSVRVEVFDGNTRMPTLAACPDDATSGRGLSLVAALGAGWGTSYQGDGKVVWVDIGEPRSSEDRDRDCVDLADAVNVDDAIGRLDRDAKADSTGA